MKTKMIVCIVCGELVEDVQDTGRVCTICREQMEGKWTRERRAKKRMLRDVSRSE